MEPKFLVHVAKLPDYIFQRKAERLLQMNIHWC